MKPLTYTLRPATCDDARTIRSLVIIGGINPSGVNWERFVVATTPKGKIIGCGQIKPHKDGTYELASIIVISKWRGKGIARTIIEHLLEAHPHPGELYLMCQSPLGSMYQKFGFEPLEEKQLPRYFRRIKRLTRLVDFVQKEGGILLVMRRDMDGLQSYQTT